MNNKPTTNNKNTNQRATLRGETQQKHGQQENNQKDRDLPLPNVLDKALCQGVKTPNLIKAEFPFDEYKETFGDYFDSKYDVMRAGWDEDQVWSVVVEDEYVCYGPADHWINVLGYVATKERHDGNTYYEIKLEMGD